MTTKEVPLGTVSKNITVEVTRFDNVRDVCATGYVDKRSKLLLGGL